MREINMYYVSLICVLANNKILVSRIKPSEVIFLANGANASLCAHRGDHVTFKISYISFLCNSAACNLS